MGIKQISSGFMTFMNVVTLTESKTINKKWELSTLNLNYNY